MLSCAFFLVSSDPLSSTYNALRRILPAELRTGGRRRAKQGGVVIGFGAGALVVAGGGRRKAEGRKVEGKEGFRCQLRK